MNRIAKTECINAFAELLLQNGFSIMKNVEPVDYFFFELNGNIGYVQYDRMCGFHFGTVHRPCREVGTGYRIHSDIDAPTIQHAKDCFAYWAYSNDVKHVKKYKGWEDYYSVATNRILKTEIIQPVTA